uniref:Uncharacterized protein n=1 Tax=Anguilla anguilla TaxID=7936 RepID=A0A0E9T1W7_ANGAN
MKKGASHCDNMFCKQLIVTICKHNIMVQMQLYIVFKLYAHKITKKGSFVS